MSKKIIQTNPSLGTSFQLIIPGLEELNYFVQTTEIPGMNMTGIRGDYKVYALNIPNNKIEYDMLNCSFLVDEDYANHQAIHLWFHALRTGNPPVMNVTKDLTLHLKKSSKAPNQKIIFYGAFPVMLTPVPLESSTSEPQVNICTVSFMYQYYSMEPA